MPDFASENAFSGPFYCFALGVDRGLLARLRNLPKLAPPFTFYCETTVASASCPPALSVFLLCSASVLETTIEPMAQSYVVVAVLGRPGER